MAEQLGTALENRRMAYSSQGKVIDPATLQQIFQDAMRHQLDRIRQAQLADGKAHIQHATWNIVYKEIWHFFAENGPEARWSKEDEEKLVAAGWPEDFAALVTNEASRLGRNLVTQMQLQHYAGMHSYPMSEANRQATLQTIFAGRSAACEEATRQLGTLPFKSLKDDQPFKTAQPSDREPSGSSHCVLTLAPSSADGAHESTALPQSARPQLSGIPPKGKRLSEALARCIADKRKEDSWTDGSAAQVATAINLFTSACGGDIFIEDITKQHVVAFEDLCDRLPNRWGRTSDEIKGGIKASLARGATMPPEHLGISRNTRTKHLTWIKSVLDHAALTKEGEHVPRDYSAVEKAFKELRKGAAGRGKKPDRQRARDARSDWTPLEIEKLLSAPVWTGCLDLDNRFKPGNEVYHDAWYWLPLCLVLYGGRSAELVGLALDHVHEDAQIPYFDITYTDERGLKTLQSVRKLPIHPELIRLGILEYITYMRDFNHIMLFPEMNSTKSKSFASTFYKSIFKHWRSWAFPEGTEWRRIMKGVTKDKDAHSFRHSASNLMLGKVPDSVRFAILGHEGNNTTTITYDKEVSLDLKLEGLKCLSSLTQHIVKFDIKMRPSDRQKFGSKLGRRSN